MTLRLTQVDQVGLLAWAATQDGRPGGNWPDNAVALGVIDVEVGTLHAVLVIVRCYAAFCDIHFFSDGTARWVTRNILSGLFGYVFLLMGVRRVQGMISATNAPALALARKAGFTKIGVIPRAMPGDEDGVLFSLLAEDCRWINEEAIRHGRR